MRIFVIGCEYAGKTTLVNGITEWIAQTMGSYTGCHDHFTLPNVGQGAAAVKIEETVTELIETVPSFVEQFQRFQFVYHLQPVLFHRDDYLIVNWYYADAVYVPLYYPNLGGHDRQYLARFIESDLKILAPDMVLVLVKAEPDVIRDRMRQEPRPRCPLKNSQDVETVLNRFQDVYTNSILDAKITIDTTSASASETLQDFVRQVEPHLRPVDRQRILSHQALQQAKSGKR